MKKLGNTEAELQKRLPIKNRVYLKGFSNGKNKT